MTAPTDTKASIEIISNGKPRQIPEGTSIGDLLELLGLDAGATGIAVAKNLTVVRRPDWDATLLEPGDEIDVVTASQGG